MMHCTWQRMHRHTTYGSILCDVHPRRVQACERDNVGTQPQWRGISIAAQVLTQPCNGSDVDEVKE